MKALEAYALGLVRYARAWELQELLASQIAQGRRAPTLLLLEHPHTYTLGRRTDPKHLLWEKDSLNKKGIELHRTDRGGDVTYHGPGQLVGYPLLPLGRINAQGRLPKADYVGYIRRLEHMLIAVLAQLGLAAGQLPGFTGVWLQPDIASRCPHCPPAARERPSKIAAIGVKVDAHGVSRHGFALNLAPDPSYWQGIIPCGLPDHPNIALADVLASPPSMNHLNNLVMRTFAEVFGFELVQKPASTLQAMLALSPDQ